MELKKDSVLDLHRVIVCKLIPRNDTTRLAVLFAGVFCKHAMFSVKEVCFNALRLFVCVSLLIIRFVIRFLFSRSRSALSSAAVMALSGRTLKTSSLFQRRLFPPRACAPVCLNVRTVYERDYRRPGQAPDTRWPWQKISFDWSKGVSGVKKHFGLLKSELMERWIGPEGRPLEVHMLEQTLVLWEFRGPEALSEWVVSSDRDIGGRSEAYVKLGRNNSTCMLYGSLCSAPPRDGETRYSGYCTMRSKQPRVSA